MKELIFRSWTGLGVDPAVQPLKGQFPRGTTRRQTPSKDWDPNPPLRQQKEHDSTVRQMRKCKR
ncbi:hypothetical protein F511_11862 [Dorcoceras hygrometricum]|uniref:Uncharacterized protein n=1 Tax=Dorcoceras hygrometricum TaxID=472368 RepID=A0A2Z7A3Y9_9LAMI|nr:hypothetical protein F511_11862 [Dorcoceras hygrometricum]